MSALGGVASPAEMRAVCPAQNPPMGGASYMEQSNLLGSPQEAFLKRSFPWFINVVCVCVCVCVCGMVVIGQNQACGCLSFKHQHFLLNKILHRHPITRSDQRRQLSLVAWNVPVTSSAAHELGDLGARG